MTEVQPEDLTPYVLVPEVDQEPLQFFYAPEMAYARHKQVALSEEEPLFFTISGKCDTFTFLFHKIDGAAANWRACRLIHLITGMVIAVTGPVLFLEPPIDRVIHLMKYE